MILPTAEMYVGTCASKWLKRLKGMTLWSAEDVCSWQDEQMRLLVKHAYEHTRYYREIMDQRGLTPDDIQTREDLKKLPILTKEIVRSRYEDLIADNMHQYKYRKDHTGGTTGSPMNYLCDENVWGWVTAAKIYNWRKTGYRYGDAFLALGSASIFEKKPSLKRRIYDSIRNEYARNSMNLDDNLCATYVDFIKKKKIHYVYGYATAVYVLADYVKRQKIDLDIRAAYTTSENLTQHYRTTIEQAFHCHVMDCYGSRDAGVTAYEDHAGSYHVGYNALLEIIDPIAPQTGTLISTNLFSYPMPFIRYEYGDVATLDNHAPANEYNGQVLRQVVGRTSDIIRLDNGHVLTAPGYTILILNFDIVAFQIQQCSGSEIVLKVQKGATFCEEDEHKLLQEMQRFAGDGCDVRLEYVDKFETNKNGKHRFFLHNKN